jgi:hypothetical protein
MSKSSDLAAKMFKELRLLSALCAFTALCYSIAIIYDVVDRGLSSDQIWWLAEALLLGFVAIFFYRLAKRQRQRHEPHSAKLN